MIINHNLNAMNAQRNMTINAGNAGKSMEKLSSGLRINRAGDDAAGLAISEKMRGQIRGLDQASRNAQDGISLIQTAEGALNETHSILQRMRELSVQAGNDTNTSTDRAQIQKEMTQLTAEINRIGNTTEFNNQKVLQGRSAGTVNTTITLSLQIGANKGQTFDVKIADMRSQALGISNGSSGAVSSALTAGSVYFAAAGGTITGGGTDTLGAANEVVLDVSTKLYAGKSIAAVDNAINIVSTERAKLGAFQNRLEHTIANLNTSSENLTSAESRIRDVDMAKEMMNFTKTNILNQAAQAMLAQANQAPQGVLQLLR